MGGLAWVYDGIRCVGQPTGTVWIFNFSICFKGLSDYYPNFRMEKSGTDFCDTWTQLNNLFSTTYLRHQMQTPAIISEMIMWGVLTARQFHRKRAAAEYNFYRGICALVSGSIQRWGAPHLLLRGEDSAAVAKAKTWPAPFRNWSKIWRLRRLFVKFKFRFREGHWKNGKTSKNVISMLEVALQHHAIPSATCQGLQTLSMQKTAMVKTKTVWLFGICSGRL